MNNIKLNYRDKWEELTTIPFLELKGKKGRAATVMRPGGKVIIDNEIYDAVAETGFIDKGEEIVVVKTGAAQLYVSRREQLT